ELFHQIDGQIEQHARCCDEKLQVQFVGSDHRVQPEPLASFLPSRDICLEQLRKRESELRLLRFADNRIAPAQRSRVVAKANQLRQSSRTLLDVPQMRNVVE